MSTSNQTTLEFFLLIIHLFSYISRATCNDSKMPQGLSLKLIDKDSPTSPLYHANMSHNERMKEYIETSSARVRHLARSHVPIKISSNARSPNEFIPRLTMTAQTFKYLVQVGIGTFRDGHPRSKMYHLALDTGTDLTWTQCEGCEPNCLPQVIPYPSSRSSTYKPFNSSNCPPRTQPDRNHGCRMEVRSRLGGKVSVTMATDDFTFASSNRSKQFKNVSFGCGAGIRNFAYDHAPNNLISGVMGMGYGFYSFTKHVKSKYKGKFSYCFQKQYMNHQSPMYLRFGNDVLPDQTIRLQTTKLYRNARNPHSYYLNLQGISVADQRLRLSPTVFATRNDTTGGCLIDTGIAMSMMVSEAYKMLTSTVSSYIRKNIGNLQRLRLPGDAFEFCWVLKNGNIQNLNLPIITFHFENKADFILDEAASFYFSFEDNRHYVCLPFIETKADEGHITVLGAFQQINHRIIFDTADSLLHFAKVDCSTMN